jgi:NADH:ubiquinone oxidoreductase subunit 5 (subunit L)/multisubunit Na+/H+ antiporter MnhA subunit
MEGPTPVSALLHAATMVTAGVYILLRIIPILPSDYLIIGSIIGLLTIILGGLIGLYQNDIKKIIAYSTCSQLGYMFYSE